MLPRATSRKDEALGRPGNAVHTVTDNRTVNTFSFCTADLRSSFRRTGTSCYQRVSFKTLTCPREESRHSDTPPSLQEHRRTDQALSSARPHARHQHPLRGHRQTQGQKRREIQDKQRNSLAGDILAGAALTWGTAGRKEKALDTHSNAAALRLPRATPEHAPHSELSGHPSPGGALLFLSAPCLSFTDTDTIVPLTELF